MMPNSACASASAASTSSHAWKRAASVNSARTPGSSIRNEVGSSCMLSASSVGMDQCQLALAHWYRLQPFHQASAVYGVQDRELKANLTAHGWRRRLTLAARCGMMPGSAL